MTLAILLVPGGGRRWLGDGRRGLPVTGVPPRLPLPLTGQSVDLYMPC